MKMSRPVVLATLSLLVGAAVVWAVTVETRLRKI